MKKYIKRRITCGIFCFYRLFKKLSERLTGRQFTDTGNSEYRSKDDIPEYHLDWFNQSIRLKKDFSALYRRC